MPSTTTSGPTHEWPEADDAQSESELHTQSCVSVLQRVPSALVAQSALVLQPVVACTPASPGGDVVVELLLHPNRASVEMIPATIPAASLIPFIELTPGGRVAVRLRAAACFARSVTRGTVRFKRTFIFRHSERGLRDLMAG
jgi:hypothetical protein